MLAITHQKIGHSWARLANKMPEAREIARYKLDQGLSVSAVIDYVTAYGFGRIIAQVAVQKEMQVQS
jgi:hypothetical protein